MFLPLLPQVPHGARHKWEPERRESLTLSNSLMNLRMNLWWMNSSTDRNGKSCQKNWTWATNKWKYGFRTGGWRRNDWWCANMLSPCTDDLWTWSWPAAHGTCVVPWMLQHITCAHTFRFVAWTCIDRLCIKCLYPCHEATVCIQSQVQWY